MSRLFSWSNAYRDYAIAAMRLISSDENNAATSTELCFRIDHIATGMADKERAFIARELATEEADRKKKRDEDELRRKAAEEERQARDRVVQEEENHLTEQYGPLIQKILHYDDRVRLNKLIRVLEAEERCKGLLWDMHNIKDRSRGTKTLIARVYRRIQEHAPKIYTEFVGELKRMGKDPWSPLLPGG